MMYRRATFEGTENMKEAACRLAFDEEPQASHVFCAVGDYVDAGFKGDYCKMATLAGPGLFHLMPDMHVVRGELLAIAHPPGETWAPPDVLFRSTIVRRQGTPGGVD